MDGTEALDGSSTPAIDSSMQGDPNAQPAAAPSSAPAQASTPDVGGQGAAPDLGAPTAPTATVAPQAPARRHGSAGILDAIADMISPAQQTTKVRDANGVMQTVAAAPQTRGQQWGHIALDALTGAATAASAPAGPNQLSRGVSAAVTQRIGLDQEANQRQSEQADHDFATQQKAKQDNLNYQLGQRQLAQATFANTRMQVQATQQDADFAQKQEDRETQLGSFDLGTYQGAHDIHQVMQQQPKFFDRLNKGLIVSVPSYNGDGTYAGLHVYERKPNVGAQAAPDDAQVAVFSPPAKPGALPSLTYHTVAKGTYSNDDVTRISTAAQLQMTNYQKDQAELNLKGAQANEANASASKAPSEINKNNAEAVSSRASAAASYASARKTNLESAAAQSEGGGTGNNAEDAHMMVDGLASPEQFSKRSKDYNAMLPEANRYSMQKYGVPFDAEISQGRFLARRDTIKAFGSGKEGDQIQTFNQFLAHAGDLSKNIDQLRQTNSPWLNTPIKDLRKAMGDDAYAKIEPMISAVRTEHGNFLNNNHALHSEDVRDGADMLNDTQTLAQSQGAIKAFTHTAVARAGALNQRYRRVVGAGDVPDLLDPYSREVIKGLGMESVAQGALGSAWNTPSSTPQQASTPPRPSGPAPVQQPAQQTTQASQPQQPQQRVQGVKAPARPASIPANFLYVLDSHGNPGWIPHSALEQAQKQDPHLQVGQ